MKKMREKMSSKKGFTLAELLIVIAIMAILMAVAIPLYSAQLEKARVATDKSNLSTAQSMAMTTYLLNNCNKETKFEFAKDASGQIAIKQITYGAAGVSGTEIINASTNTTGKAEICVSLKDACVPNATDGFKGQSSYVKTIPLTVTITEKGAFKSVKDDWADKLKGK